MAKNTNTEKKYLEVDVAILAPLSDWLAVM
mgnify:CR=1 FL=1